MDRTVLATGSCGPTPVLGVQGIATYALFFMLKKLVFIPVPDFHGPTSQSSPILRTMDTTPLIINPVSTAPVYSKGDPSDEYFIGVKSIKIDGQIVKFNTSLLFVDKKGVGGTKISTINPYTILHTSIYKAILKDFVKKATSRKIIRVASVAPFGACFSSKTIAIAPGLDQLCQLLIWSCKARVCIGGFMVPIRW